MIVQLKDLAQTIVKQQNECKKAIRSACYKSLERTAEQAREQIIKDYPEHFKDEPGIRKNRGVPKMTRKTKVDKNKLSISLNWGQKQNVDFMDDNEFGGTRTGENGKSKAMPSRELQRIGRTSTGRVKQQYSIGAMMNKVLKAEATQSSTQSQPKPFIMVAKNGHHMIAQRMTKARDSYWILYHFDRKVKVRPRWKFNVAVHNVTVRTLPENYDNELEKALKKVFRIR